MNDNMNGNIKDYTNANINGNIKDYTNDNMNKNASQPIRFPENFS